jgi:hypothetical protein
MEALNGRGHNNNTTKMIDDGRPVYIGVGISIY